METVMKSWKLVFDVETGEDREFLEDVGETLMSMLELIFGEGYIVAGVVADPMETSVLEVE